MITIKFLALIMFKFSTDRKSWPTQMMNMVCFWIILALKSPNLNGHSMKKKVFIACLILWTIVLVKSKFFLFHQIIILCDILARASQGRERWRLTSLSCIQNLSMSKMHIKTLCLNCSSISINAQMKKVAANSKWNQIDLFAA